MQVIGLCRFSYPAEGGFQVEHRTLAERMAYLYAPGRLEERFRQFETVCLPALRAQTDPDFTFLVLVGESLPARARDRLHDLTAGMPQVRIVARPPLPHRKVCRDVLNAARDRPDAPCLQFRHDDDDAVAVTFVETLREVAADAGRLLARHRLVGLDWNRGYALRTDARGLMIDEMVRPYLGVAQAVAVAGGVRQSIMNFAHNKLVTAMPTITFTEHPAYVRGYGDFNDSRQKAQVEPVRLRLADAAEEALFRDLFAIDADHVRRVFAGA
ncbi:putative rhamnosyl transferase [Roseivivax isoporae]|uniref:Rhamnosyl transferase n=1 Tax=Roseivivax isoporae LMG 25204 TaxID=1449351 RepID=X7FDP9_9RHOB|nr:putative rhamnosyl transferase [Roseivivax isoporae]ETX31007.1 hypothetical protein RISW2_01110 [Roseivivax isoporae LMG 25204]